MLSCWEPTSSAKLEILGAGFLIVIVARPRQEPNGPLITQILFATTVPVGSSDGRSRSTRSAITGSSESRPEALICSAIASGEYSPSGMESPAMTTVR